MLIKLLILWFLYKCWLLIIIPKINLNNVMLGCIPEVDYWWNMVLRIILHMNDIKKNIYS